MSGHDGSFTPFSQVPEYREVNASGLRELIERMDADKTASRRPLEILDIATGVGTIPELLLANLPQH